MNTEALHWWTVSLAGTLVSLTAVLVLVAGHGLPLSLSIGLASTLAASYLLLLTAHRVLTGFEQ